MTAKPERLALCGNHDYLTFLPCLCNHPKPFTRFAVTGTDYGRLRNTSGDLRLYRSYSGAYKMAKRYNEARK